MDWREAGRHLRESRRQRVMEGIAEYAASECETRLVCKETNAVVLVPNNYMGADGLDPVFRGALWGHFHRDPGSPSPLVPYLCSERPLGPNERRALAAMLAAADDTSPDIGRPQDIELRQATTIACTIYDRWCAFNKKEGIPDHGHRGEMKDLAARETVEDFYAWRYATHLDEYRLKGDPETFIEAVRVLMDKSKRLRDPGEGTLMTVPGPFKRHQKS